MQALAPTLVRIEERGPHGFEDRPSFHMVRRDWPGVSLEQRQVADRVELSAEAFRVVLQGVPAIEGVRIHAPDGTLLFDGARPIPAKAFLPGPSVVPSSWVLCDSPRIIPPPWGALPPPPAETSRTSGWDLDNPARDVFVFLPGAGGYRQLVSDFISLTGRIPLPPLCMLGLIDSRYYAYTQAEALAVIETYREHGIPLDVFVWDTDWRVGASHGYAINTALLPDLAQFVRDAHARGVRVMLNDHPEPAHPGALSPEELRFRHDGLVSLLKLGVDYWWFDRNWHVTLEEPAPGLSKEVWGMRLYHDIVQAFRPDARAVVLSNVEGIDNGQLNHPPSPAAHTFPIWWTGDTRATWADLERGVRNAVNGGVLSLLPYISEDIGGHHDTPDDELYARFVQYGALSPICRLHCSANLTRHPWQFGAAGEIAADYIRLRYRLLPLLYAAARESHDSGLPILRRLDLEWPDYPEAQSATQYMLGQDLLVAPILESVVPLVPIPTVYLRQPDGQQGLAAEYFSNPRLEGEPVLCCAESDVVHGWFDRAPNPLLPPRSFSVRWTGKLGPVAESGLYRLAIRTNDRVKVWLDGDLVIDFLDAPGPTYKTADLLLERQHLYSLRIEYRATGSNHAMCELLWGHHQRAAAERTVWVPPGCWHDCWTGCRHEGPTILRMSAPLAQTPLLIRGGGLIFSIPPRESTGEAYWPDLVVDWFVPDRAGTWTRELYEDDGHSRAYLEQNVRTTRFTAEVIEGEARLSIEPARGKGDGPSRRHVRLRVHGLAQPPRAVWVNEVPFAATWAQSNLRLPLGALAVKGGAMPTPVLEIDLGTRPVCVPQRITLRLN